MKEKAMTREETAAKARAAQREFVTAGLKLMRAHIEKIRKPGKEN